MFNQLTGMKVGFFLLFIVTNILLFVNYNKIYWWANLGCGSDSSLNYRFRLSPLVR